MEVHAELFANTAEFFLYAEPFLAELPDSIAETYCIGIIAGGMRYYVFSNVNEQDLKNFVVYSTGKT